MEKSVSLLPNSSELIADVVCRPRKSNMGASAPLMHPAIRSSNTVRRLSDTILRSTGSNPNESVAKKSMSTSLMNNIESGEKTAVSCLANDAYVEPERIMTMSAIQPITSD